MNQTNNKIGLYRNRDWLYDQYVNLDKSAVDIAELCGVSVNTIWKWLNKLGVRKAEKMKAYWDNPDWLKEHYTDTDISIRKLAEQIGISSAFLSQRILEYGVQKGHYPNVARDRLEDREYLYKEYIEKNRTVKDLCDELNCSSDTLYKRLVKFNLIGMTEKSQIRKGIDDEKVELNYPEFCYIAGLISVDGHIVHGTNNVILSMQREKSEGLLKTIHQYLDCDKELVTKKVHNNINDGEIEMCILDVTSKKLVSVLNSFGMKGLKKSDIRFPDMEKMDDMCQRMFIRGMMDGDGTQNINKVTTFFRSPSKGTTDRLCDFINNKFDTNIKVNTCYTSNGVEMYYISMGKRLTLELFDWIYTGYGRFRLEYKYEKYNKIKR